MCFWSFAGVAQGGRVSDQRNERGEPWLVGLRLRLTATMAEAAWSRGPVRQKAFSQLGVDALMSVSVENLGGGVRPAILPLLRAASDSTKRKG